MNGNRTHTSIASHFRDWSAGIMQMKHTRLLQSSQLKFLTRSISSR